MKLLWNKPKEEKILFPIMLNKYSPEMVFIKFILLNNDYLFLFIDLEVFIYRLEVDKEKNKSELVFENKKTLDFISFNEDIQTVLQSENFEKDGLVLISTNTGNIYTINFNLTDFYFDIHLKMNIRHNFIHEYEVLQYEGNNILMIIDKQLFSFEITKSNSVIKNLLFRMNDMNEKIVSAFFKPASYAVIFTNENIYLINFETDGTSEVIYKKDPQLYKYHYTGIVANDVIYYVKDNNSFAVYHIYDREKKFTVKLSAKNLLNDLNFYRIVKANSDLITIVNEKQTELYFINNKYKLIHRESVLFEKSFFIFHPYGVFVFGINLINMVIKYKVGMMNEEIKGSDNTNGNVAATNVIDNIDLGDLSKIENYYIRHKNSKQEVKNKIFKKINAVKTILNDIRAGKLKFHSEEQFEYYKSKITRKLSGIKVKSYEKFKHNIHVTLIWLYTFLFGSYSLKKSFNILFFPHFLNIYKERLQNLLLISKHVKDVEVYNEIVKLTKIICI